MGIALEKVAEDVDVVIADEDNDGTLCVVQLGDDLGVSLDVAAVPIGGKLC